MQCTALKKIKINKLEHIFNVILYKINKPIFILILKTLYVNKLIVNRKIDF